MNKTVYGIDFAKNGSDQLVRSFWRVIEDKKYHCYAIQRRRRFLWWTWWASQYLCNDKQTAESIIKQKTCQ